MTSLMFLDFSSMAWSRNSSTVMIMVKRAAKPPTAKAVRTVRSLLRSRFLQTRKKSFIRSPPVSTLSRSRPYLGDRTRYAVGAHRTLSRWLGRNPSTTNTKSRSAKWRLELRVHTPRTCDRSFTSRAAAGPSRVDERLVHNAGCRFVSFDISLPTTENHSVIERKSASIPTESRPTTRVVRRNSVLVGVRPTNPAIRAIQWGKTEDRQALQSNADFAVVNTFLAYFSIFPHFAYERQPSQG